MWVTAIGGVAAHPFTRSARQRLERWMFHPLLPRTAQAGAAAGAFACVSMAAHALDLHVLVERWREQDEEKQHGLPVSLAVRPPLQPVLPGLTDRTMQWLPQSVGADGWLNASLRFVGQGEEEPAPAQEARYTTAHQSDHRACTWQSATSSCPARTSCWGGTYLLAFSSVP